MYLSTTPTINTLNRYTQWSPRPYWSKSFSAEWFLAQLIFHSGQRWVVSGHSQSLQLTGLGKSFPLMCWQQSGLNYKRKVNKTHTVSTLGVSILGDRGGCATGSYRTSTTLGHFTKLRRYCSPINIETNTWRLPKWGAKERWSKWKMEQNSRKRTKQNGQ